MANDDQLVVAQEQPANGDQLVVSQPEKLNYIEETVLKKRKSSEEWAIRRKQQLLERKWQLKQDKQLAFKRAEDFIKAYRSKELDIVKMRHRSKRRKTEALSSDSRLLFVIRIQRKVDIHPKIKKILNSLGLKKTFSGIFLKATKGNLAMLQRVEPYVTYGYPNLKNVRDLILKKGNLKVDKQMVPLTNNNVIEETLGKYNILCVEDLVHEIANVGPHFKEVTQFMWPFTLNKPEADTLKGKKNTFKNGGDSGNREDLINELIDKMN